MKILMMSLLLIFSLVTHAMSVEVKIHLDALDSYQVYKKTFKGGSARLVGDVVGVISRKGNSSTIEQLVPATEKENNIILKIHGRDQILWLDQQLDIDEKLPAQIKLSLLGKIKKVKIDRENYLELYKEHFEDLALNILHAMHIDLKKMEITFSFSTDGYRCQREDNELICRSSIDIVLIAN